MVGVFFLWPCHTYPLTKHQCLHKLFEIITIDTEIKAKRNNIISELVTFRITKAFSSEIEIQGWSIYVDIYAKDHAVRLTSIRKRKRRNIFGEFISFNFRPPNGICEKKKIARFSAVAAAIFTAPPQNRAIFKAPRCAISSAKKIASERRFSLRLKGTNLIPTAEFPAIPESAAKIASERRCAILVVFLWKIAGKGRGRGGWRGGVGTGKGTGKSMHKLCRNYTLANYPLVSPPNIA